MLHGMCRDDNESSSAGRHDLDAAPPADPAVGVPSLAALECGIIPRRMFPLRKWYFANPDWYYHAAALEHHLEMGPAFIKRVDPALRELCAILIEHGLCTTPSCQGHFYPDERFGRIWDELCREAEMIRTGGLIVRDSETGAPFRYHDPGYRLDWPDGESFCEQASRYQSQGYLGIAIPVARETLAEQLATDVLLDSAALIFHDEELSRILSQPLLSITVTPQTPAERDAAWGEVTSHVHRVLASAEPPSHP